LLELGDACPRGVGDALRLGPGPAGGVKLVGEVLGERPMRSRSCASSA
jgi:hypothetical protein